jgi:hypothetical protein|nr:MAG TPA: leucine rich repeat protein [Caudoviricetes sp.]
MQMLYCGLTDFSTVVRNDPQITIYGDESNSTVRKTFIENLAKCLNSLSIIELKEITVIEDYALSNLQVSKFKLILPDTLITIGKYAFQNCTAMNDIVIPASVTEIGEGAFYGCNSLNNIYFKEDTKITYIPELFCSGGGLNTVGIEYKNGTRTVHDTIEFPKSITKINNNAFYNCGSMGHTCIIGDNITTIGDYAFYGTTIDAFKIGTGINTGSDQKTEDFDDGNYDTDRDIKTPYVLYLSSKRQFRYKHFVATEDMDAGTIYLLNKKEYEVPNEKTYVYKTDDDDFKFCLKNSHLLIFKNGLLLPKSYYYLHSIINTPITDVGVVFNISIKTGDIIDIFYVTNDLFHIDTEYYDEKTKERYITNGDIELSKNEDEYRVMGNELYENSNTRTNYIKMHSPLYGISSKHSVFVFLNGKKIRLDELEDISDTIMSIKTDYSVYNPEINAAILEVLNHLDTQDIIEQVYINDGLHPDNNESAKNQFTSATNQNIFRNTRLVRSIDLTKLESYAERTLLDKILNDLSDENLNKLFYNYDTAKGPMTMYRKASINEPDFINRNSVITSIVDKYYITNGTSYIDDKAELFSTESTDKEVIETDTE